MVPERSRGDGVGPSSARVGEGGNVSVIVDIANVMGARADGWWKDRARAAARLCREVGDLSRRGLAAGSLPAEVAGLAGVAGLIERNRVIERNGIVEETGASGDRVYPHWVLVLEGAARKAAVPEVVVDGGGPVLPATLAPDAALSEAWLRKEGGSSGSPQNFRDLGSLVRLVLAPGSGDDAIAAQARDLQGCRIVVTADRELRRRCEQTGAIVTGPRWLLNML
ncbi:MAG TPA: hypothetical protein VI365_05775 [Trebonia sp.]